MAVEFLNTASVRKTNKGIKVFVIKSDLSTGSDDVDLFVVEPPPKIRDPAHHADFHCTTDICNNCRKAFGYLSYYLNICRSQGKDAVKDLPAACLLHVGIQTLEEGLKTECHLCVLVDTKLRGKRLSRDAIDQSNIEMCWQTNLDESPNQVPLQIHFALTHEAHARSANNYWNFLKLKSWPQSKFGSSLFASNETDPFVFSSSTGSELSKSRALEWISQCQANKDGKHHQCNQTQSDALPTRLLDVVHAVENSSLRLVTPSDNPDAFLSHRQYVTLSHCWGAWGAQELPVLTTANLGERLSRGLDVDLLPPTFKEALEVAQWFKVRWLWIDSLCIVQDSMEDWKNEAVRMYEVYKNALLNISADDSNDARWGCFRSRPHLSTSPMQLSFEADDTVDSRHWFTPDSTALFEGITDAPLAERAWVFQERQLSRRVLHFTYNELIWECCAEGLQFASETFPRGAPFEKMFNHRPKFQSQSNLIKSPSVELYRTWNKLCEDFSTRKLSHIMDKVMALSGLAQEFQASLPNDSYMAGMWRSTLPSGLMWTSANKTGRIETNTYVAPSWSWLSMNGAISDFGPDDKPASLVKLLSVVTKPLYASAPTGMSAASSIELHCYLRAVKIQPDYEKKPWYMMAIGGGKNHRLTIEDEEEATDFEIMNVGPQNSFDFSLDRVWNDDSGPESISAYFIPLCIKQSSESSSMTTQGLLLEATDDHMTTFKRIGTMTVYGSSNIRMSYKLKSGREQASWEKLESLLQPSYEKVEAAGEVVASGALRAEGANEVEVEEKLSGLDITGASTNIIASVSPEKPDLDSLDALERLYAFGTVPDLALVGSGSECDFDRLVPHNITLL